MADILIINTGGTIDAESYENTPERVTMTSQSVIPESLQQLGLTANCDYAEMPNRKDSKDFNEADLARLTEMIIATPHEGIIVLHGTDDMVKNAKALTIMLEARRVTKRVLFTGAMYPIKNDVDGIGHPTDGYRNIAYSMEKVSQAPQGVTIAFDERLFDPQHTYKNMERRCFVSMA